MIRKTDPVVVQRAKRDPRQERDPWGARVLGTMLFFALLSSSVTGIFQGGVVLAGLA